MIGREERRDDREGGREGKVEGMTSPYSFAVCYYYACVNL